MSSLFELYENHTGKISDKWSLNLYHYDHLFVSKRQDSIRLLEIGIQNGGSLELWNSYFPHAELIVGCDINPLCSNLEFTANHIKVIVDNAYSKIGEAKIKALSSQYDIIIEDGSHQSVDIINAFSRYFPLLADEGLFIAEDLHCCYWLEFGGGLAHPFSAISFFKHLADVVNSAHWGIPFEPQSFLEEFNRIADCNFTEDLLKSIYSVEFTNSLCIIKKKSLANKSLGPRKIVGTIELVSSNAKQYADSLLTPSNQEMNLWAIPPQATNPSSLGSKTIDLRARMSAIEEAMLEKNKKITDLEVKLEASTQYIFTCNTQITHLISERNRLSMQLGTMLAHLAVKLGLHKSPRLRKIIKKTFLLVKGIYQNGFISTLKTEAKMRRNKSLQPLQATVFSETEYLDWAKEREPTSEDLEAQKNHSPKYNADAPLFSIIIPVYKVPQNILEDMISSLSKQTWQNWEACIVYADIANKKNWDLLKQAAEVDSRLKIQALENRGISLNSNAALKIARGEFVVLLDHDDELTPWVLYEMAQAIRKFPTADFLYSDKDSIDISGKIRQSALFKPQWSPEMLYSVNYLTHLNVMRRKIVNELGGWHTETDGAQDWDLFLRVTEKSRQIIHVPTIGYHWRIIPGSTSTGMEAKPYAALGQLRTLENRLKRLNLSACILPNAGAGFRVQWFLKPEPCVDLILFGDKNEEEISILLDLIPKNFHHFIASISILHKMPLDVTGISSSLPPHISLSYERYTDANLTKIINQVVKNHHAATLMLLDMSIKKIPSDSFLELISWTAMHPDIAFTGGISLTEQGTVLEAGRIVGDNMESLPFFRGADLYQYGIIGGPLWYRNVSVVSPGFATFKRSVWSLQRYLKYSWPKAFTACCIHALQLGKRGLVNPYSQIVIENLIAETKVEWNSSFKKDPYFHPAFGSIEPITLI